MSIHVSTAEQIQNQMKQVRTDLRQDVQELVDSAREMTVWQRYVQAYPWVCLGAAALAGYMIVPTRARLPAPDARMVAELVDAQVSRHMAKNGKPSGGMMSSLVSGAVGMAVNGLLSQGAQIAAQHVSQYLAQSSASRSSEPHTNGKEH